MSSRSPHWGLQIRVFMLARQTLCLRANSSARATGILVSPPLIRIPVCIGSNQVKQDDSARFIVFPLPCFHFHCRAEPHALCQGIRHVQTFQALARGQLGGVLLFSTSPSNTLPFLNPHRCSCPLPARQMRRRNHGALNSRRLVAGDPRATAVPLPVQSEQAAWLPAAGRCLLSLQAPTLPSHLHSLLPGFLLPREKWGSRKEARLPRHTVAPTSICAWLKLPSSLWLKPCSKQSCCVLQPSPAHPLLRCVPTLPSGYLCLPLLSLGHSATSM